MEMRSARFGAAGTPVAAAIPASQAKPKAKQLNRKPGIVAPPAPSVRPIIIVYA